MFRTITCTNCYSLLATFLRWFIGLGREEKSNKQQLLSNPFQHQVSIDRCKERLLIQCTRAASKLQFFRFDCRSRWCEVRDTPSCSEPAACCQRANDKCCPVEVSASRVLDPAIGTNSSRFFNVDGVIGIYTMVLTYVSHHAWVMYCV